MTLDEAYEKIDEMSKDGTTLNDNIFRPSKNGFIGKGNFTFTFKGKI